MAEIVNMDQKRLQRLAPAKMAAELMRLPAKRRMEVILDRSDAEAVVAALDANDFFFTMQEIGPDDSLPLLALASREQVDHLFDLEWWRKDRVEAAKALTWLERLERAGDHKLLDWLYHADFELLITLFTQWITVEIAPEDVDLVEAREALPSRTLDDLYFWETRYPQFDNLIMHMLSMIFEVNYSFYRELMSGVLFGPAAELDELSYQFHKGRLTERSIPDYYEALEIYRALKPEEFRPKEEILTGDTGHSPPSFALALVPDSDLLARAVRAVDEPRNLEMIQYELASLANKVVVADQLPADSSRDLRRAVEKALAYVNLGLEIVSEGEFERAVRVVENSYLEHLFRLAHQRVARIKGRLQKVVKFGWLSHCGGAGFLDGKWAEIAEALLAGTPRLLRKPERPGAAPREDFLRTPGDLAEANHLVDVITAAGYLSKALRADLESIALRLWSEGQVRGREDMTLGVLVLTAAANFVSFGKWSAEPLPVEKWPEVFPLVLPPEMEKMVAKWVGKVLPDEEKRALGEEYISAVLLDYETQMRPFSEENAPEPHLTPFFMFAEPR